jgi:hypothetical protein
VFCEIFVELVMKINKPNEPDEDFCGTSHAAKDSLQNSKGFMQEVWSGKPRNAIK